MLSGIQRERTGRPSLNEENPELLRIILEIATLGAPADPKRRSEILGLCTTLEELRDELSERGFQLSKTALYYRLQPRRKNSIDGKRHVTTVSVRLCRATNSPGNRTRTANLPRPLYNI